MAAPNDFQVFISHGREDEKIQPRVVEVIEALNAVPAIRPRVDRYVDGEGALVRSIAFITDGSPWRDRIEGAMYSVDAAIICLDPISAASKWVLNEATTLTNRSRAEPGFRIFYLHDGELFASPSATPWSDWDPLRPQDRQLTKWSDLGNVIAEIRAVAALGRSSDGIGGGLLHWLVPMLVSACEVDPRLRGQLLDACQDSSSPVAASVAIALAESGSDRAVLTARWVAGIYAEMLVECRRRGWSLYSMDSMVGTATRSLDRSSLSDRTWKRKVFRDLLSELPADNEVSLARAAFHPGPAPAPAIRRVADARCSEPRPLLVEAGASDGSEPVPRIDVRDAIRGRQVERASDARGDHVEYLRDVLAIATGIRDTGEDRKSSVPIADTGEFALDLLGRPVSEVLRSAMYGGRGKGDGPIPDDYCDASRHRDGPLDPFHILVRCGSFRVARRLGRSLADPTSDERTRPLCSILLDVTGAADRGRAAGPQGFDSAVADSEQIPDLLRLDPDRVRTRASDFMLLHAKGGN